MSIQGKYGIWGQSDGIRQVFEIIDQVSGTDISVLIIGESGTGKELVAKAIHSRSPRADKSLIIVNCGAIPEGILESELFGHEKGAFTGAIGFRKGFFEMADQGTIFLDEIGEMPLNAQVKILRVLEGKEFNRVGGSDPQQADVRIIAATNRDLEEDVRQGNFRQDLFFRLRAVNILIPPLRKRKEDIMMLAHKFAEDFCEHNKISFAGFDPSARHILENYPWPGNVRELRNLIESVIVLEKGNLIDDLMLSKYLKYRNVDDRPLPIPLNKTTDQAEREFLYRVLFEIKNEISQLKEILLGRMFPPKRLRPWDHFESIPYNKENDEIIYDADLNIPEESPNLSLEQMERDMIEKALRQHNGNKRQAAKNLKISERTLYRKIKEYGLPF